MSLSTELPLEAQPTHVRYLVVAALCVAAALAYVQRNSYGGAETTVIGDLQFSSGDTANAVSLFFLSYALFQVPAGWLAQRAGPRWTLTSCTVGWSVALGLCALASNPFTLIGGRMLMGVFQAGLLPAATLIVAAWLSPARRGTASGLLNSFMLVGGALQSHLTGLLLGPLGWRGLFLAYAGPGLAWALLFALWFRNRPEDHPGVNDAELSLIHNGGDAARDAAPRRPVAWTALLTSAALYAICLQQFLRAGANRFVDNTFATYLQLGRHLSKEWANELASMPQWACVFGGLVGGVLSDYLLARTGSRRIARQALAVGSLIVCLAFYVVAYFTPDAALATGVFSVGSFVFFFTAPIAYAVTIDVGGRNLGVIFGLMNMAGNFGAYAFTALALRLTVWFHPEGPPAFGASLVGLLGSPSGQAPLLAAPGLVAGPPNDWTPTLLLFFAMHVAALVCWLAVNPNGVIGEPAPASELKE